MSSDFLPGYDAWKTDAPDWESAEEEAEAIRKREDQKADFKDALLGFLQDNRGDLWLSELWDIVRDALLNAGRDPGEPQWQTDPKRWPPPDTAAEMLEVLLAANRMLVRAFDRIHVLPRATDTELANHIEKMRGRVVKALAKAGAAS